jgi:hypothetical protein
MSLHIADLLQAPQGMMRGIDCEYAEAIEGLNRTDHGIQTHITYGETVTIMIALCMITQ